MIPIKIGEQIVVREDFKKVTYRVAKVYKHLVMLEREANGHTFRTCISMRDVIDAKTKGYAK